MKHFFLILFAAFLSVTGQALAQDRMYRCDNNYYTNSLSDAKALNCKLLEGGNVTVVQGTRPQNQNNPAAGSPVRVATSPQSSAQSGQRVDAGEQRSRDSDAKVILESELKKAEARRQELAQEYNSGEPDKRGDESRNYQKYLDRVGELKTSLQRIDNDIAGIRRELNRAGSGGSAQR